MIVELLLTYGRLERAPSVFRVGEGIGTRAPAKMRWLNTRKKGEATARMKHRLLIHAQRKNEEVEWPTSLAGAMMQ